MFWQQSQRQLIWVWVWACWNYIIRSLQYRCFGVLQKVSTYFFRKKKLDFILIMKPKCFSRKRSSYEHKLLNMQRLVMNVKYRSFICIDGFLLTRESFRQIKLEMPNYRFSFNLHRVFRDLSSLFYDIFITTSTLCVGSFVNGLRNTIHTSFCLQHSWNEKS